MTEMKPIAALIDATDRRLIGETAGGLPLSAQPYLELGRRLGLAENEVIARLSRLRQCGVIRRIAAVPNHYRLGFRANAMSVWDVEDGEVSRLGREVGRLDFVTHCYRRPRVPSLWPYNLFAMVHGRGREEVEEKVETIAVLLGPACRAGDLLYSKRILKKTGLRLKAGEEEKGHVSP